MGAGGSSGFVSGSFISAGGTASSVETVGARPAQPQCCWWAPPTLTLVQDRVFLVQCSPLVAGLCVWLEAAMLIWLVALGLTRVAVGVDAIFKARRKKQEISQVLSVYLEKRTDKVGGGLGGRQRPRGDDQNQCGTRDPASRSWGHPEFAEGIPGTATSESAPRWAPAAEGFGF